jgi:hypothetical protein
VAENEDKPIPSFVTFARQTPGVQITPAAVFVDARGRMVPTNKSPTDQVTAIRAGSPTGMARLFIPMTFTLRVPNNPFAVVPLTLYVTPSEIQIARKKALSEHVTRQGTIREEWGDELDVWTCSGTIAAFYSQKFGLTQVQRNQTVGYKNFLSLLSFYKNNGRSYYTRSKAAKPSQQDRERLMKVNRARAYFNREDRSVRRPSLEAFLKSKQREDFKRTVLWDPSRVIKHVGAVEIAYDFRILVGHFDNFEWEDNVSHPHNINYSFSFTVKCQFDLAAQVSREGTVRA